MLFRELNNEQRRLLIDVQQIYEEFRSTQREFNLSFKGTMHWRKVAGKEYLYRIIAGVNRSLGPRSAATEKVKEQYTKSRRRFRDRKNSLKKRLEEKALMVRALKLGRIESTPAKILRRLDEHNLLGPSLTIVGTNALYAYEAMVGVHFQTDLLSTEDADFLWDMRRGIGIAGDKFSSTGLIGILKKVDPTFTIQNNKKYRAVNKDGYYVDLIVAQNKDYLARKDDRMAPTVEDLYGAPIKGLDWLINSPKIEAVAIDENGLPLHMSCVDPRVFALHKLWMSKQVDRDPYKKNRDQEQAQSVAALVNSYLAKKFSDKDLKALPKEVYNLKDELKVKGKSYLVSEEGIGW